MPQETPQIPPEADVIRLARKATGMTAAAAARASKEGGRKGIGEIHWRNVERGWGGRRSKRVRIRASDEALADMALVVGVEPDQLAAAGREGAAKLLAEILRREGISRPARPAPGPEPGTDWIPILQADEAEIGPWEAQVWKEIALAPRGRDSAGAEIFGRDFEIATWDTPQLRTPEEKVRLIAKLRMFISASVQSRATG
jgi:hypothetical protein